VEKENEREKGGKQGYLYPGQRNNMNCGK